VDYIEDDTSLYIQSQFTLARTNDSFTFQVGIVKTIEDGHGHDWLEIRSVKEEIIRALDDDTRIYRVAIVPVADGYQFGDPIYKSSIQGGTGEYVTLHYSFAINWEWAPKNISGFRVYVQRSTIKSSLSLVGWPDAPDEYKLCYECQLRTESEDGLVWSGKSTGEESNPHLHYTFVCSPITDDLAVARITANIGTLAGDLNRGPTYSDRQILTPRVGVHAARGQGAIMAVDVSDRLVNFSVYNGDGNHNEDVFPNISVDGGNAKEQIVLLGTGEILGMVFQNGTLYVFHRSDLDIYDYIQDRQDIQSIDCVARRSILGCSAGTFWAGQSFIYWLPTDGSSLVEINKPWANFYNGTLTAANGIPFVSAAQREVIISGWDPFYREAWFLLESADEAGTGTEYLIWRFNPKEARWNTRKLANNTHPRFFSQHRGDNTFSVGVESGLLLYPNIDSDFPRRDLVATDDTGGSGFESLLYVNIGSVYNLSKRVIPSALLLDHESSTYEAAIEKFSVELYGNRWKDAIQDPVLQVMDTAPQVIRFEPLGALDSMRLKISLPTVQDDLDKCDRLDIYRLQIGFKERPKLGT
jgi:hypothetical protein